MTDETQDELTYDSDGNAVLNPRIREQLRSQEKQLAEMKKQVRTSELNAIYSELGIPNSGLAKLFRDGYQGDVSLDAVRNAASEYDGLIPSANSTQTSQEPDRQAELDAIRRVNGATDPTNSPEAAEVLQDALKRLKAAKNLEEFDDIMSSPEIQALRSQPISYM